MQKAIWAIIGVVIIFIMFPMVITSIDSFQTDSYTETESNVTTGAGITGANVTLNNELWDDNEANVTAITSNESGDAPTADDYTATGQLLQVVGLDASTTRTLVITYDYGSLSSSYTGLSEFARLSPFLILVAVLFVVIGAGYKAVKERQ